MTDKAEICVPAIAARKSAFLIAATSICGLTGLGAGLGLGAGAMSAGYAGLAAGAFLGATAIEGHRLWCNTGRVKLSSRTVILALCSLLIAIFFSAGGWLSVLAPVCFGTLDAASVVDGMLAIGGGLAVGSAGILGALVAIDPLPPSNRNE